MHKFLSRFFRIPSIYSPKSAQLTFSKKIKNYEFQAKMENH